MITEENIYELICSVFKTDKNKLSKETLVEHFAKDSMDVMEFIAVLESEYKVKIEPEKVAKLKNIGEILDYAQKNQTAANSET